MELESRQYPIGRFEFGRVYTVQETLQHLEQIQAIPAQLAAISAMLTPAQWASSYRPGGWTVLQLVNHFADVFINGYMRTKWILTENNPTIKTYDQERCAQLPDSQYEKLSVSLALVQYLIERWVFLLMSLPEADFERTLFHPEYRVTISLREMVAQYAWHGRHHLAHLDIIHNS